MTELATVYLHIRKLFGSVIPGVVWAVLLLKLIPTAQEALQVLDTLTTQPFLSVVIFIIASYLLGLIGNHVSIRLVDGLGEIADRISSAFARSGRFGFAIMHFLAYRCKLGSTRTLAEDLAARMKADTELPRLPLSPIDEGRERWGTYKLYVVEHARALGKELYDIEGEINFIGSLAAPALVAGIAFAQDSASVVWVALLLFVYLALRFQYLRHYEIQVVRQTYAALMAATPGAR